MNRENEQLADLERQYRAINWKDELSESDEMALRKIQGDLGKARIERMKDEQA